MENWALDYADSVLNGTIPACQLVKKSCERFKRDLLRDDLTYDLKAANYAINFIQLQKHTKGEWRGRPLLLEPWQKFIVGNLFGFYRPDGRRKYTRAYLEMPKKQGKSPLAAAIGNLMLADEADGAPEVYSIATKLDQAAIVWGYAADMFKGLSEEYELSADVTYSFNNKRIVYNGGVFKPIAYDEKDTNDGYMVSCGIIDEYHAHPSGKGYDILARGVAARRSPLILAITTAGHNRDSACYSHREFCVNVLNGVFDDDDLFVQIYTIDEGDAWDEESTWIKANPNYGISVKPEYIKAQIAEARESGVKRDSFLIKHLNVWTDSYQVWVSSNDVAKCNTGFIPDEGETCYAGLDLASSGDFSALSFDFEKGGKHRIVTKYYLPEAKAREWAGEIGQRVREWGRLGFITITAGNTTDYEFIEKDLKKYCELYNVETVAYDPWNAKQFASKMNDDGINMKSFAQSITNISHPTKRTEEFILSGNFEYDGNPVTAWMFSNVNIYTDANLNIKAIKSKDPNKKIDGVISIIMAIGEAIDEENKKDWFFEPVII